MNKKMSEMMRLVEEEAITTGRCCYLFQMHDKLNYCFNFMPGWLFKAYPGGRTQLSVDGSKIWNKKVT
jgi:hypothetical protein